MSLSVRTFFLFLFGIGFANAGERVYDAADLVRAARMIEGIIPADPDFADLDGDGQVTANDLALMLRRVHGQELPVRLEQKSIGPLGGSIGNTNTFLLIVPEGAFTETETLTLELVPDPEYPAAEDVYGPLYQVSGIPDNVPVSLTVRIPLPDGGNPTNSLLEMGEYTHGSNGGPGWYYRYVDAQVDGNSLVWNAPPIPEYTGEWMMTAAEGPGVDAEYRSPARATASSTHRASYQWRSVVVRATYFGVRVNRILEGDHFRITWNRNPSLSERSNAWHLVDALEEAYALLAEDFDFSPRTLWPVDVYMKRLGGVDPGGEMVSSWWGVDHHWIEIDDRNLWPQHPREHMRTLAGHEFFHIVQSFYHARKDTLWLDEATATWFEKFMYAGDPDDYTPEHFPMIPRTALRGMHIELGGWVSGYSSKDVQSRGYTVASFVEFLDRRHNIGLAGMVQLHERLKAGDHPVQALMTVTPGDATEFRNQWRDYTRAFFNAPVWSSNPLLLADPPPTSLSAAFIRELNKTNTDYALRGWSSEGPYGRILSIDTRDDFATLREYRMRVQQMGARSVAVAMMDREFTDQLPDTVRMIGEVQWEDENDMSNLRLMPVFQKGPPSQLLFVMDHASETLPERSVHRIEVSFPRPIGRFTYMLGVFNDDVRAPYDRKPYVTLRHYIGSYRVPPSETSLNLLSSTQPVAVGELRDVLLHGDLGMVRTFDVSPGAGRGPRDIRGVWVRLPHDGGTPVRVHLEGGLKEPLTRVIEQNHRRWTVTVTDDAGWRVTSEGSGIEDEDLSDVIPADDAWNTGIELPAPEAGGNTYHGFYYYFSASVLVEDLSEYGASSPYTWTTDSWYVMPLYVILQSPTAN